MYHCYTHDIDHRLYECPKCEAERRHEELLDVARESHEEELRGADERHQESIEALRESDHKRANPGEYECPHCLYIALKRGASRCPTCHAGIDPVHWDEVREREKAEAERAEAERQARLRKEAAEKQARLETERVQQAQRATVEVEAQQSKEFGCFFLIAVLAALIAAVVYFSQDHQIKPSVKSDGATSQPAAASHAASTSVPAATPDPEQIIDRGICPPFGTCGERWYAKADVELYGSPPPDPSNFVEASLEKALILRAGQVATAESGIVVAKRRRTQVFGKWRALDDGTLLDEYKPISCYSPQGGNYWKCWIRGRAMNIQAPFVEGPPLRPEDKWWVQIRMSDGSRGWTRSPQAFVRQSELDEKLSNVIAASKSSREEKLARVDALIKQGADLNMTGKDIVSTPFKAAIQTMDLELLNNLIARGLTIRSEACLADDVRWIVFNPGGDLVLELLLQNGLRLNCLKEPPLQEFLMMGIAREDYSVENATKIARILVGRGAEINEVNSHGKSIFDLLDGEDPSRSRFMVLRDTLDKLSNNRVRP